MGFDPGNTSQLRLLVRVPVSVEVGKSGYLFLRAADSSFPWTLTVPTFSVGVASSSVTSKFRA